MWFYITMFICNLLIPVVMIFAGYWMYRKPPREINAVIGYRTKASRKNKDTWLFAHDYCGRLWLKLGIVVLVATIIVQIPFVHASEDAIGNMTLIVEAVQILTLLGSIVPVEKALKRTFDENGVRR